MVEKLHVEMPHSTKQPIEGARGPSKEYDNDFHAVFEQFINIRKVDAEATENAQQNHRVQKKGENTAQISSSLPLALSRSNFIRANRFRMMMYKVKGDIKKSTQSQKKPAHQKVGLTNKTFGKRKLLLEKYGVKKGREFSKLHSGKAKYHILQVSKQAVSRTKEIQHTKGSVLKENVKDLKNVKTMFIKKMNTPKADRRTADVFVKVEHKQEIGSALKETLHGERDGSLISAKYENNIPKILPKPDYQMVKNADEIFDEIVRQFSFIVRKGGGEANIVLQPDILGKLKLNLKLNQQEVHSVIIVDNQSVKDLILSRLNILEQSLLQQGFSLGSFHVEVNDKGAGYHPDGHEIGKALKRGGGIESKEEIALNPALVLVPDWLSTVINVTA